MFACLGYGLQRYTFEETNNVHEFRVENSSPLKKGYLTSQIEGRNWEEKRESDILT